MFFDLIFILICTFFVSLAWFRFYINETTICLILATLTSLLLFILTKKFFASKNQKKQFDKKLSAKINQLAEKLSFTPEKKVVGLFSKLPQIENSNAKISKNTIVVCHDGKTKKLVFDFSITPMATSQFCKIAKSVTQDVLEVFAVDFEKQIYQIATQFDFEIKLFNKNDVYFLLEENNILPPLDKKKQNVLLSNFFYIVFDKSRTKYYLSSSIFLILTSFLTFFKTYYIVSGTILFLIAIFAKFNTKFNQGNKTKKI